MMHIDAYCTYYGHDAYYYAYSCCYAYFVTMHIDAYTYHYCYDANYDAYYCYDAY